MNNKTERVELRVGSSFLEMINEWRRKQPDLPSVSEAIRTLCEIGVKAEAAAHSSKARRASR